MAIDQWGFLKDQTTVPSSYLLKPNKVVAENLLGWGGAPTIHLKRKYFLSVSFEYITKDCPLEE
jgi:hypothetical protein